MHTITCETDLYVRTCYIDNRKQWGINESSITLIVRGMTADTSVSVCAFYTLSCCFGFVLVCCAVTYTYSHRAITSVQHSVTVITYLTFLPLSIFSVSSIRSIGQSAGIQTHAPCASERCAPPPESVLQPPRCVGGSPELVELCRRLKEGDGAQAQVRYYDITMKAVIYCWFAFTLFDAIVCLCFWYRHHYCYIYYQ